MKKLKKSTSTKDKKSKKIDKKKIKKLIIDSKETLVKNIKNSPLLATFIILALLNELLLRKLTVNNMLSYKPFFVDVGIILIFSSFTFLFKPKNRPKYLITLSILMSIICTINCVYYSYYSSFASISLLATSTQIGGVTDAVYDILKVRYFIFLLHPILIFYLHTSLKKKNAYQKEKNKYDKKVYFPGLLTIGIIILLIISMFMTPTDWSRFTKMWNRESVVTSFGVYVYQLNDIVQSLEPKINNLFGYDKSLKEVTDYYNENKYTATTNEYTNIFEGKNVIVIHAESLQTIAMQLSFNGEEVTPNINKLASEGIFFSNFYSQVGVGTSSDAEFTFSTSLMPSSSGTVFVNYFDRQYVSIQQKFKEKGYYTFSMHGNTADFWNRAVMHKNLGYDKFYSKSSYDIDETIGLGISDKSFLKQSVPMIKEISKENKNFYGTIITLTNHTPFNDLELMDEYPTTITTEINGETVTRNYINNTTLGNYFRSVHYADQALGQFIEDLDETGILDNTVLVIYGDHDSRISEKYYNILYNYDPQTDTVLEPGDEGYIEYNDYTYQLDKNVPFIIWTKDQKFSTEITTPAGMIDAFPTLGNMFGIHSDYQLGTDIMSIKDNNNTVVFSDGSYLTDKIYYDSQKGNIYPINNAVVDEDYISEKTQYANTLIEISNNIITYDLIKELESKD